MFRRSHRPAFLALAAATALGLTAGCAAGGGSDSSGSSAGGEATLTLLTFETPNLTAKSWDDAIARVNAQVPGVKIKKLVSPTTDRATYAKQLLASGQLPDIMIAVSPTDFVKAGALAPFSADQLNQFMYPNAGAIGGKTYQLPWATQTVPFVYYNKDAFTKAGISSPPTTRSDFLADCAKLKDAGITPIEIGGGGTDTWADQYPLVAAVSADLYPQDPTFLTDLASGKASFTDPRFVAAADKVAKLASAGYLDKAGLSRSYANTEQAFRDGKAAMYPMGSWFPASADTKPPSFQTGVFTWPTESGQPVVPVFTGGGMTVSAKAPNVALAQKWALAFSTGKTNLDAQVKADGLFMAIKGYTPPADAGAAYNASFQLFQKASAANQTVNSFAGEQGDGSLPPGTVSDMQKAVVDLINGGKSAEQFAQALQDSYKKNTNGG
ncbi:ABC transporter substrate-binding protein [Streptomyces sp. NRRL WC-3742]|uniref:ABC transporter substrate-binding protein n=1 Tax=Streptomyces sp. NRRL WC-3742 TaxID=1463934 RepID=UPI000566A736|nr:extracellular solute-binding protein [Streptomyces sp. NRRL WC-3742]